MVILFYDLRFGNVFGYLLFLLTFLVVVGWYLVVCWLGFLLWMVWVGWLLFVVFCFWALWGGVLRLVFVVGLVVFGFVCVIV